MAWPLEPLQPTILVPSKFGHSIGGDSTSQLFAKTYDYWLSEFVGYLFAETGNSGMSNLIQKMRKGSG